MGIRMGMPGSIRSRLFYNPPAQAARYAQVVAGNGGSVSSERAALLVTLLTALQANGSWWLTGDMGIMAAEDAGAALTSLRQLRVGAAVSTPTFTADEGYTFDGAANYVDTKFVPLRHAVAMSPSNCRMGLYIRTNVTTSTAWAAGASEASPLNFRMRPRTTGSCRVCPNVNSNGSVFTLPASDSSGFLSGARNGAVAASVVAYKNGSALTKTADSTSFGATLPNANLYIGGDDLGGLNQPLGFQCAFWCVGASLSASQEGSFYTALQTFMTAIGANV